MSFEITLEKILERKIVGFGIGIDSIDLDHSFFGLLKELRDYLREKCYHTESTLTGKLDANRSCHMTLSDLNGTIQVSVDYIPPQMPSELHPRIKAELKFYGKTAASAVGGL